MIKLKSLIKENTDNIIIGVIDNYGVIKSSSGTKSHLGAGLINGKTWRYNKTTEMVYWNGDSTQHDEEDEFNVQNHLKNKYGYSVKRQVTLEDYEISPELFQKIFNDAHGLSENINK